MLLISSYCKIENVYIKVLKAGWHKPSSEGSDGRGRGLGERRHPG